MVESSALECVTKVGDCGSKELVLQRRLLESAIVQFMAADLAELLQLGEDLIESVG